MNTGYDNFWMYQNSRHEPVLSLPKNDNCSYAVSTDSYKQVINGRCPNHLNSCITPQNNVARSHQSNQHRMTGSQYVWPSSVYSLPFRSSYANNFQSQEAYSNQSGGLNYSESSYSSQKFHVQQNYDSRYLRKPGLNFPYVNNNSNSDKYNNTVKAQSKENTNSTVARIRVKDVFSLNNNSIFDNNLLQTNQKELPECPMNYAAISQFVSCDPKAQPQYMQYEKINFLQSNNQPSHYGHTVAEQSLSCDQQQCLPHSRTFYQPNAQLSFKNRFQLSGSKEKSLPSDAFKTNPSLTGQLPNLQKIQEAGALNNRINSNDVLQESQKVKPKPTSSSSEQRNLDNVKTAVSYVSAEKSNNTHYPGLLEANDKPNNAANINNQSHCQENLSDTKEPKSFNHDSLNALKKWRKTEQCFASSTNCPSQNLTTVENSVVKSTIPYTYQSSFLRLNDSNNMVKNSHPSLPCLSEQENQVLYQVSNKKTAVKKEKKNQENGVMNFSLNQVGQDNSVNTDATHSTNHIRNNALVVTQSDLTNCTIMISPSKALESTNQGLHQKELVVGVNSQEKPSVFLNSVGSSEKIPENLAPKNSNKNKKISTEDTSCNNTTLNVLIVKQETFGIESPCEKYVPENQTYPQAVKTEKNSEDSFLPEHKPKLISSENLNPSEKTQLLGVDNTENIDFRKGDAKAPVISSKKNECPKSKTMSSVLKNAENRIQDSDVSKSIADKKNCLVLKNKTNKPKVEKKIACTSKKNYKSKINKNKLDLLIEFLNEKEDTIETKAPEETNHPSFLEEIDANNKMNNEVNLNHNRRKLSKACIVKNKNNSREMISLISHKVARDEVFKSSSKTSQIVEANKKHSDKSNEKKSTTAENKLLTDKSEEKKSTSAENKSLTDKSEEKKSTSAENKLVSSKNFDFSEKQTENNNQTQKDSLKFQKNITTSGNTNCRDTAKESSSKKECGSQEEENVINTMRAFQNFKTHFCMSCNLISGIDSFWVNIVSGELRCLNCFKKMLLKTEDNILKLKTEDAISSKDLDTNFVQKSQTNQESEIKEENKQEINFENDSKNKNRLLDLLELYYGNNKIKYLKENIKEELIEAINESIINKIISKTVGEQSLTSNLWRAEFMNSLTLSRRQSEPIEDNASVFRKILEEQKNLQTEEAKSSQMKEDAAHKTKVCESNSKQEAKKLQEKFKIKSLTKEDEYADKFQKLKASPIKSKENASATETFSLHYSSSLEGKNMLKKTSISPKFNILENYNEEMLPNEATRRSISKEPHVASENSKQAMKECKKQELTERSEKSYKKITPKQEGTSEEFQKAEKKQYRYMSNEIRKRNNSKEEFICQNTQISNEHSKKEIKLLDSDKSVVKMCSTGNCACHKTPNLENIKRNSKRESLEKLKLQSPLKEVCSDHKTRISDQIKLKETHTVDEFKRKCVCANNPAEKHKKVVFQLVPLDQSRKRKNSDECFATCKVRVVEEQAKRKIKPVAHLSDGTKLTTKENIAGCKNKASEFEKQNLRNSNSRKTISLKTECSSFGKSLKRKTRQAPDSLEKWKAKGDLPLENSETPEYLKLSESDSSGVPRRRSKEECVFPMSKELSKNDNKKIMGSEDKLKNYTSKENFGSPKTLTGKSFNKEIKNGSLSPKIKEWEKKDEKVRKFFCGRIPKKSHAGSDMNINEIITSPLNYELEEVSNMAVKKNQNTRFRSTSPNRKFNTISIKSGKTNLKRMETDINRREREVLRKQGIMKIGKKFENDSNQRQEQKNQAKDLHYRDRKGKAVNCCWGKKEEVLKEGLQSGGENENIESATLLAKLIKKTKVLSWSLLKGP